MAKKSKFLPSLILTEPQADHLADALEESIESAHEETVEFGEGTAEFDLARDRMKALLAILDQIDPENPIFDAEAKPGREFDWDAFWEQVEKALAEEEAEEDAEEEAESISVASEPSNDPSLKD